MGNKLKLYVWEDFEPDYTSGLAFAIAEDEESARNLVKKDRKMGPYDWGALSVFELDSPISFSVSGGS